MFNVINLGDPESYSCQIISRQKLVIVGCILFPI